MAVLYVTHYNLQMPIHANHSADMLTHHLPCILTHTC